MTKAEKFNLYADTLYECAGKHRTQFQRRVCPLNAGFLTAKN